MTNTEIRTKATSDQIATMDRMLKAPAMRWIVSGTMTATLFGVPCDGIAIRIEAPTAKIWGVILPSGAFLKPKAGRKTIDAMDVAIAL